LLRFRLDKKRSRGLEVLAHVPILPPHLLLGMLMRSDGTLRVQKIEKGVLIWRNPLVTNHSIVQIYSKNYFLAETGRVAGLRRKVPQTRLCRE
jgi:hypothetical protein